METVLIEKLIIEPGERTVELLLEDDTEVFLVDWREDDKSITEYCENLINTNKLSSSWFDDDLIINYGEKTKKVPLTYSASDRHITLCSINEILSSEYEVRMVWDSDGSDTLAFTVLPIKKWDELELKYGAEPVSRAFLRLTSDLNTFTQPLYKYRPRVKNQKQWWQFWK